MVERVHHRSLSFQPPPGWLETSQIQMGHDISGGIVLSVGCEWRYPSEPMRSFEERLLARMRERAEVVELRPSRPPATLPVGDAYARAFHVRFRARAVPIGTLEQRIVLIARPGSEAVTVLSMLTRSSPPADLTDHWSTFLRGVRFDERSDATPSQRLRHHGTSFAPPAGWSEIVAYAFERPAPERGAIAIMFEPRPARGTFRDVVDQKIRMLQARSDQVTVRESASLSVAGHAAHRIRFGPSKGTAGVEETLVLVDGAGVPGAITILSAAAAAGEAARDTERVFAELQASVALEEAPADGWKPPTSALVRGSSVRAIELTGRTPEQLHERLVRRGFVPTRVPLFASTTRTGQRRFWRTDGVATTRIEDPMLTGEWIYAHADGGVVRVFPHGIRLLGSGNVTAPLARTSVLPGGASDLSLESELCAIGAGGILPEQDDTQHADAWTFLVPGPAAPLPLEDRVGLGLTRTLVPAREFQDIANRAERLAPVHGGVRRADASAVRFSFARPQPGGDASVALDLGNHVIAIDSMGPPDATDRLQRFLRALLRGERYQVFDDATAEDVTATVTRLPSFLVGRSRHRPELFLSPTDV